MLTFLYEDRHDGLMGRPSKTEPYRAFVQAVLLGNPNALTVELLDLAREEGYDGGYSAFFTMVKNMRPDGQMECRECHVTFKRGERRKSVFCSADCRHAFHTKERAQLPAKGQCYACRSRVKKGRLCRECRTKKNESQSQQRRLARETVIAHYGSRCACTGCKETRPEFMAFDHVEGNGNQHRRKLTTADRRDFARWVIRNGFPKSIRLLCHNCNCARGYYGYCPHEKEN